MRAKRINISKDNLPEKTTETEAPFFGEPSQGLTRDDQMEDFSTSSPELLEDVVHSSSESDDSIFDFVNREEPADNGLKAKLAQWAINHNITHVGINDLLKLLKPFHKELPLDSRTLLHTIRTVEPKLLIPGQYFHFGLKNSLTLILNSVDPSALKNVPSLALNINIDGLPLSKSSANQVYPILVNISGFKEIVEIVGIYYGREKPANANDFLRDFVDDAVEIIKNGFDYNGKHYIVILKAIICDAPAKSFVKCVKGHSGYFSCTKCYIEGEYVDRVYFPKYKNLHLRQDTEFRSQFQPEHHVGVSVLQNIPDFNMIDGFPLDYMHLICLGVTKKLLYLWCYGKPGTKISFQKICAISDSLNIISSQMPEEFNRKPRSLNELKRWKATEFRQFLFYSGVLVLRKYISSDRYINFLTLHVSLRILSNVKYSSLFDYARELLEFFVKSFKTLYGAENISHNVHNLLHLAQDVKNHGPVDEFSAFPFENYLQTILKLIRKSEKPLQQIVKRYSENTFNKRMNKPQNFPLFKNSHQKGPLQDNINVFNQYETVILPTFSLRSRPPNNVCCLKNGDIVQIANFAETEEDRFIIGKKYVNKTHVYHSPCKSSELGIFKVDTLMEMELFNNQEVEYKCVHINLEGESFVFPLLHSQ